MFGNFNIFLDKLYIFQYLLLFISSSNNFHCCNIHAKNFIYCTYSTSSNLK